MITVSIVSHGHGSMVTQLVQQLKNFPLVTKIVVTRNIPEEYDLTADAKLILIRNHRPKGFGANHNAAFQLCETPFYCVLNPDIELAEDPFPALLSCSEKTGAALVAPLIRSPQGELEDSIRHFPTVSSIFWKLIFGAQGRHNLDVGSGNICPDWVGGMFMQLRAQSFREIGGFDEVFFLYYEDVDLCARLWKNGKKISVCASTFAVHNAQRASRKNARHLVLHLSSMLRYFGRYWLRLPSKASET